MQLPFVAFLLLQLGGVVSQRQISGVASPGNTIHAERDVELSSDRTTIKISSVVPVTVQRYNDGGSYLEGEQPVPGNFAKVLVTSDCDTSETSVVPNVVISDDGSVTVELDVLQDEADAMPFLEPSSYAAFWTWVSDYGNYFPCIPTSTLSPISAAPIVVFAYTASPSPTAAPTTVDNASTISSPSPTSITPSTLVPTTASPSSVAPTTVAPSSLAPTTLAPSSLAPTSITPSTLAIASSTGSSSPMTITTSPAFTGSSSSMIIGMCNSDEECTAVVRSRYPAQSSMGVELCQCYAASSVAAFDECEGDATCIIAKCTNTCDGFEAYCDIASSDDGVGECTLRPMSMSVDSTVASTTGTAPTVFSTGGDFPTPAPSPGLVPTPPSFATLPDEASDSKNSAFGTRSFSLRFASTFMAIVMIFVIFQGNGEGGYPHRGLGKFAVVAMAVSSIYSRSSRSSRGGNNRKSDQSQGSFPSQANARNLQTCSFNVEILIDGCTKSVEIDAPAGRVVDAVITNQTSTLTFDDGCRSISDLSANIAFPVTSATQVLDLAVNNTVEAFPEFDYLCMRMVIGRPFVDATGGSHQAMPYVVGGELSLTDDSWGKIHTSQRSNVTSHGRYLLVEDWTQRALGEHASVASFSAFSIALMTNQAPSDLVNDALKAGLDEVRHATTSFEIASMLAGRDVRPGPLPPSSHVFRDDLKALALAVAREGCVDETISAFAAAFEVEHITEVLDEGIQDSLYSNIDRDILAFIRDEQVKIAMDESNHSALAWRTLNWVCTVDPGACASAYNEVFDESKLEMRFKQRAKGLMGRENSMLHLMRSKWRKIFNVHRLAHSRIDERRVSEPSCEEKDMNIVDHSTPPLLTSLVDNVLRKLTCD